MGIALSPFFETTFSVLIAPGDFNGSRARASVVISQTT
jgi:hypothetical protein